jgi:hypothetical protein
MKGISMKTATSDRNASRSETMKMMFIQPPSSNQASNRDRRSAGTPPRSNDAQAEAEEELEAYLGQGDRAYVLPPGAAWGGRV